MGKRRRYRYESKEIDILEDGKVKVGPWGENRTETDKPIAWPRILVRIEVHRNWEDLGEVEAEEAEGEEIKEGLFGPRSIVEPAGVHIMSDSGYSQVLEAHVRQGATPLIIVYAVDNPS